MVIAKKSQWTVKKIGKAISIKKRANGRPRICSQITSTQRLRFFVICIAGNSMARAIWWAPSCAGQRVMGSRAGSSLHYYSVAKHTLYIIMHARPLIPIKDLGVQIGLKQLQTILIFQKEQ